jgi:hypothetical protein
MLRNTSPAIPPKTQTTIPTQKINGEAITTAMAEIVLPTSMMMTAVHAATV